MHPLRMPRLRSDLFSEELIFGRARRKIVDILHNSMHGPRIKLPKQMEPNDPIKFRESELRKAPLHNGSVSSGMFHHLPMIPATVAWEIPCHNVKHAAHGNGRINPSKDQN